MLPSAAAFTLVELLVAIAVLSLLAAIALPATKELLKEQRVSRGASLLQGAIQEARGRSVESGGGGGLIIDRLGNDSLGQQCESVQVRFATTPPEYSGEPHGDTAYLGWVDLNMPATPGILGDDSVTLWFPPNSSFLKRSAQDYAAGNTPSLINIGDELRLGVEGLPLKIVGFNTLGTATASPTITQRDDDFAFSALLPAPLRDEPMPADTAAKIATWTRVILERVEYNLNLTRHVADEFEFTIRRSPRAAIAQPIALPRGTSIDLSASGVGISGHQFSPFQVEGNFFDKTLEPFVSPTPDYGPIYILFNERGEVSRVLAGQRISGVIQLDEVEVIGDVHLLVGEAGQVKTEPTEQLEDQDSSPLTDANDDGTTPILNPESIWLTIRSGNGETFASPWINPTDNQDTLVPFFPSTGTNTAPTMLNTANTEQIQRYQSVLTLTRDGASSTEEINL